jgi:hypothetical protein
VTKFTVTNAATRTFPSSPQRCGIEIFISADDVLNLQACYCTVDGNRFGISPYSQPTKFTLQDNGDMPTRAFTFAAIGATQLELCVIEHFAPEEYLAAGLQQYKSEYKPWQK